MHAASMGPSAACPRVAFISIGEVHKAGMHDLNQRRQTEVTVIRIVGFRQAGLLLILSYTSDDPLPAIVRMKPIAAHGKLMGQVGKDGSLKSWLQAGTPKRWFAHFYLAGLVSCVVALVDILLFGGSLITTQLQVADVTLPREGPPGCRLPKSRSFVRARKIAYFNVIDSTAKQ